MIWYLIFIQPNIWNLKKEKKNLRVEKLYELKNYMSWKIIWVKKLYELKNYMSWKIIWVEKLYESKLYELKLYDVQLYESKLYEMLLSQNSFYTVRCWHVFV